MFSFINNDMEKATNNPQLIELGKVSELTLGSWGEMLESVRMNYHGWLSEN